MKFACLKKGYKLYKRSCLRKLLSVKTKIQHSGLTASWAVSSLKKASENQRHSSG